MKKIRKNKNRENKMYISDAFVTIFGKFHPHLSQIRRESQQKRVKFIINLKLRQKRVKFTLFYFPVFEFSFFFFPPTRGGGESKNIQPCQFVIFYDISSFTNFGLISVPPGCFDGFFL